MATDSTSGIQYHHPDRLGTRLVTNTSGGIVSENIGLPFGNTITGESNNLVGSDSKKRFTSYDRSDNTKLDYAVNRHYSAAQGRFTQVDPIGIEAVLLTNPQSLNLYAYCFNDPINHVDPDGLFVEAGAGGTLHGQRHIDKVDIEEVLNDPNKFDHVFASKHKLIQLGPEKEALKNISKAVLEADRHGLITPNAAGVIETTVLVKGHAVFVRGRIIQGVLKIGTVFIP